jgi:hypothetical protein
MKRVLLIVLLSAALAAANPVTISLLSEFSADSAHQWLELCPLPDWGFMADTLALTGWRVVTSTSACTLNYVLSPDSPFVVIDSTGLATHEVGSGSFRLRPDSDFIQLYGTGNPWPWDEYVNYPVTPTDAGNSLAPPQHCSASFWNYDGSMSQCFNWYIDSQPTPGDYNTHSSTIAGSVIIEESLVPSSELLVEARGEHAYCCYFDACDTSRYAIGGLGAGWYHLEAYLFTPHGEIHRFYPDSIEVGYNQTVSGINIDLRTIGVAEPVRPTPSTVPYLRVRGVELEVLCPIPTDARLAVYDLTGACRAVLHEGLLESGVHQFDLTSQVRAGVYFAQLLTGRNLTTRKVVVTH